jgi:hypothetical protein
MGDGIDYAGFVEYGAAATHPRPKGTISLVLGVCGFLISLYPLGVLGGAGAGLFALLFGWAALTEQPLGWPRRAARAGIVAGDLSLVVCAVWVVLFVLGE